MEKELKRFINDELLAEAVRLALVESIKEYASDRAIKGESTEGVHEAYNILHNMLNKLQKEYMTKPTKAVDTNQGM